MLTIRLEGISKVDAALAPDLVRKAAIYAVNDTARGVRTEASRAIREVFNLGRERVDREVKNIRMASFSEMEAIIRAQGRPIGLTNFGAKWVRNVAGRSRSTTAKVSKVGKRMAKNTGVSVRIFRGKTTLLPHAFMGRGRRGNEDGGGSLHVFQRRNANRGSLINKASITIASMFAQERVMTRLQATADSIMQRRFDHHFKRLMK